MRSLLLVVCACSASAKPPPTIEGRAPAEKSRAIEPLIIKLDDSINQYEPACLVEDSSNVITVEVPSYQDDCQTATRPDDDWFNFELPRKKFSPGDQFVTTIVITKYVSDDEIGIPIVVRFTMVREQPPFLVFDLAYMRLGDASYQNTVKISGELAVRMR
jgi:hypothetical protein